MKRVPKRKPRTFKVWVALTRDDEPAEVVWGCDKQDAEDVFGHKRIVSATLTLTGKRKPK